MKGIEFALKGSYILKAHKMPSRKKLHKRESDKLTRESTWKKKWYIEREQRRVSESIIICVLILGFLVYQRQLQFRVAQG